MVQGRLDPLINLRKVGQEKWKLRVLNKLEHSNSYFLKVKKMPIVLKLHALSSDLLQDRKN